MNITHKHGNSEPPTTIIIKRNSGNTLGIVSFIFGLISIFVLAPIFVPLAVFIGIIAVIKKQFTWGIIGLVCAFIGFFTSPILLGLVGAITVGSVFLSNESPDRKPFLVEKSQSSVQKPNQIIEIAKGKSLAEASPPAEIANQPKDKALVKDTIHRDFKAGPVTVSTFGKCSPIMDECESYAVLHYGDESLKIDDIGRESHPISEDDISWGDNRYVTIDWDEDGCAHCGGIKVALFDDGKLSYLGEFREIKDGYLLKAYDALEFVFMYRERTPFWFLYFKNIGNKAILDDKYTCQVAKENYDEDKKGLLTVFATPKKLKLSSEEREDWTEENVTAPLLRTLALARYCGWQNESIEILEEAKSNDLVTWQILQKVKTELSQVEQPLAEQ
jgi:hypothetical protein